jgi:hypothetical protein
MKHSNKILLWVWNSLVLWHTWCTHYVQNSRGKKESWHKNQWATPAAVRRVFFMRACVPKVPRTYFQRSCSSPMEKGLSLQQRNKALYRWRLPIRLLWSQRDPNWSNIWCFKSVVVKGFFGVAILCATFRMHLGGGPTTQEKTNQERTLTSLPGALGSQ